MGAATKFFALKNAKQKHSLLEWLHSLDYDSPKEAKKDRLDWFLICLVKGEEAVAFIRTPTVELRAVALQHCINNLEVKKQEQDRLKNDPEFKRRVEALENWKRDNEQRV